ncbi:CENP-V/GFA domain-containing protein [Pseudozyma hubeiensis]|nr:CENP-V/GFA domain-containing protein [Pseudozyma hubeiensis]
MAWIKISITPTIQICKACSFTMTTSAKQPASISAADKSSPIYPLTIANDGFSGVGEEKRASATCFCGQVQLSFPTVGKGFRGTFLCHCTDCRTITAAAFANNFTVELSHIEHIRGQSSLKQYAQSTTIASGNSMTNSFCSNCGTLMYRVSSGMPDLAFMRVGTVDDYALHDTVLKPQIEIFAKDRLGWLKPLEGVKQSEAQPAKL